MTGGGGHKQILGGTKSSMLRIRGCRPKNKGFYCKFSRILRRRPKKRSLSQKCTNFHDFWGGTTKQKGLYCKIYENQFLLTNSGVTTSILISGIELHSSGTELVTFFGARSLLGGHNSCLGAWNASAPECLSRGAGPGKVLFLIFTYRRKKTR